MPRTCVSAAINSSSLRREVRVSTTVPSSTFADRSRSDASLLPERPAARSASSETAPKASGVNEPPTATRTRP